MEFLKVFVMSLGSAITLFLLTKLMGEKQISKLSLFDYVVGITIGSIAAEMATGLEKNPLYPILAMSVYALLAYGISVATTKSVKVRKFLVGDALILMDNGIIYRQNLKKAKIDLGDFLTLARIAGYFDVAEIQTAILENNGNISFLPRASSRPVEPGDLNLAPKQEYIQTNVILDGNIMYKNLRLCNVDEAWLVRELKLQGYNDAGDVYLATCSSEKKLSVYPMRTEKLSIDRFE